MTNKKLEAQRDDMLQQRVNNKKNNDHQIKSKISRKTSKMNFINI